MIMLGIALEERASVYIVAWEEDSRARREEIRLFFIVFCDDAAMIEYIGGSGGEAFNKDSRRLLLDNSLLQATLNDVPHCHCFHLDNLDLLQRSTAAETTFPSSIKFEMTL